MSWWIVIGLAAGAYAFKALGMVVIGSRRIPTVLDRCLALIPAALLAAIIAKDTFSIEQHLTIDARAAGVGAAVIAAWRRAPVIVVIVLGGGVTALVRQLGS